MKYENKGIFFSLLLALPNNTNIFTTDLVNHSYIERKKHKACRRLYRRIILI